MAASTHLLPDSMGELVMSRVFRASRESVFGAWTDAAIVSHWWGAHSCTHPVCEVEARTGGCFFLDTRCLNGQLCRFEGHFSALFEPELLEIVLKGSLFPWLSSGEELTSKSEARKMFLVVTLQEYGQDTLMNLCLRFPLSADSEISGPELRLGWEESFDCLAALLALHSA
jgi:uncharacterized protein YndB with AHSA1/START domain